MSDDWAGPIELATHAAALIEAIRTGRAVPAGRLFGLPNCPATTTGLTWPARLPSLAYRQRPSPVGWRVAGGPQPLPRAATTPLPAVLARNGDHVVADQRESRSQSGSIGQIRSVPSCAEPIGPIAVWRAVRPYATRPLARPRTGWHVVARNCPAARHAPEVMCYVSRSSVRASFLNTLGSTPHPLDTGGRGLPPTDAAVP